MTDRPGEPLDQYILQKIHDDIRSTLNKYDDGARMGAEYIISVLSCQLGLFIRDRCVPEIRNELVSGIMSRIKKFSHSLPWEKTEGYQE